MLLSNKTFSPSSSSATKKKSGVAWIKYALLVLFFLAAIASLFVYFFAPQLLQSFTKKEAIFCSAEKVIDGKFINGKHQFGNGNTQSKEAVNTGTYACKLNQQQPYGMSYLIHNPKKGSRYRLRVWRKSTSNKKAGQLVVSAAKEADFYQTGNTVINTNEKGWELIELVFNTPKLKPIKLLKCYVYTKGETVFFDDLSITYLGQATSINSAFAPETFALEIAQKNINKLYAKREQAFKEGLLVSTDDDWVKGNINMASEEKMVPVELRLKGDWLDHLKEDKWSYRIKTKNLEAWNNMLVFSVQNPATREFLSEWLLHQLLKQEGVLSPRYDFVNLTRNDKPFGIYAYEEHFDKHLPEFQARREGPIVRFNEDGLWQTRKRERAESIGNNPNNYANAYSAANTKPFKASKIQENEVLAAQFKIAHNLMHQYKYGLKPTSEIFDLDLLAKYYVIADITRGHHGIIWHNQRFYYNPITSKLEPIGFDGFGGESSWVYHPFLGYSAFNPAYKGESLYKHLFTDAAFITKYTYYLEQYTQPNFLKKFFQTQQENIKNRTAFLQEEFPTYHFDKEKWIKNAKKIRHLLFPYNDMSLQVYQQATTNKHLALKLSNHHVLPLKIIGFGTQEKVLKDSLQQSLPLLPTQRNLAVPIYTDVQAPPTAKYVFFQLAGVSDKTYYSAITTWPVAENNTPSQKLFSNVQLQNNEVYTLNNKRVLFRSGKHQITKDLLIPKGYKVHFEAGVQLDFVQGAKFISYSPVYMYGNAEAPIHITSSDKSAGGFTVLQAPEKSKLYHVTIDNFSTLDYKGWKLTGAATFYESDVLMGNCAFINNHCEDALNLVRSNFEIEGMTISNTFSDGFDADFCKGNIRNSRFVNTGNDGMDFSGSVITIQNCSINNAGDKGISVGEEATVKINSASIDGAVIGVASKDLSVLTIKQIDLKNCQQGFAAYQKKPAYGGSKITVEKYTTEAVKFLHQIAPNSQLKLGQKVIKGQ